MLGIGDDCAIYRPRAGEDLLFTTDQMIEGVHFAARQNPEVTGQRALARSLSDIAAMGGAPRFCLVTLSLPAKGSTRWIAAFYRGLVALAQRTDTELAGGDLAHDDKIRCDVMVCGTVRKGKALRRDGARPGDVLYVSGRLGRMQWDQPIRPRLALGQALAGRATACIDLSDGLSIDLHRLALASGVAAEIERIPIARSAKNIPAGLSGTDRALHAGEDYELLFTLPPNVAAPRATIRIGTVIRGAAGTMTFQGRPLLAGGYNHFKRS